MLAWGIGTSFNYIYKHATDIFRTYFMSCISIESHDDIYDHVMDWITKQTVSKKNLSLIAKSGSASWDTDDIDDYDLYDLDDGELLNFSNWDAKSPPKFQPYFGTHRFWHKGRVFELERQTKEKMMNAGWGNIVRDEETLRISCIGRSTQPIKDLIKECQNEYFDQKTPRTTVRRPATKEMRSMGRTWTRVAKRPSRPINTVVLDEGQKQMVLSDVNEYLHPAAPRWYANRGIPYRRGYLFHGPPGTGKTSLSFSIAGIFGLDIFCISLLDPNLSEEDLSLLFSSLPRRCVVLLEDIDSAGLIRRDEASEDSATTESKDEEGKISAEIAKAIKSVRGENKEKGKNQGISLSGLLNAIDGVASHEGRVLVMTTNHVEKLDPALIRPGRVDMKVEFSLASQNQVRQLFVRMYSPDSEDSSQFLDKPSLASDMDFREKAKKTNESPLTPPSTPKESVEEEDDKDLDQIAADFAGCIPEKTFTPAEIQGFLLTRKKEPKRALKEVKEWIKEELDAKQAKSRAS